MLLHVFGHVQADHGLLVVEEELGQGPGELRLADARRAEEDERGDGPAGLLDAGPGATDRGGDGPDGRLLADDPPAEDVLHADEPVDLALEHLGDGDAGPLGDDLGHVLLVDLLLEHPALGLDSGQVGRGLVHVFLKLDELAIADLGRFLEIATPLGVLFLDLERVALLLEAPGGLYRLLRSGNHPCGPHQAPPLL